MSIFRYEKKKSIKVFKFAEKIFIYPLNKHFKANWYLSITVYYFRSKAVNGIIRNNYMLLVNNKKC